MSNVKVKSYVPKAIKANESGSSTGLVKTAIMITTQAKSLAPVDKGQLKGSIMWKQANNHNGGNTEGPKLSVTPPAGAIYIGSAVEHATDQEYGTRHMAAQPFLRPAVDIITRGNNAEDAMAKAMQSSIKKAVPK